MCLVQAVGMCWHLMSLRDIGSGRSAIAILGKLVFNFFFYFNSSARGNTYSVVETNKPQLSTGSSMAFSPVHRLGQNRFTPQTNPDQIRVTVSNGFTRCRVKITSLEGDWLSVYNKSNRLTHPWSSSTFGLPHRNTPSSCCRCR